jgi:hypothetical protein
VIGPAIRHRAATARSIRGHDDATGCRYAALPVFAFCRIVTLAAQGGDAALFRLVASVTRGNRSARVVPAARAATTRRPFRAITR